MQRRNPFYQDPSESLPISHRLLMLISYVAFSCAAYRVTVLDFARVGSAAWLSALAGAVLALPSVLAGCALVRKSVSQPSAAIRSAIGSAAFRALCALLAAAGTLEAAFAFSALTESASYATLYAVPGWALLAFTFAVVALIAYRGGNASGGVAAVWVCAAPALYALTLIPHIPFLNLNWLFPFLGPGAKTILECACPTALLFSLIPFVALLDDASSKGAGRPCGVARLFLCCAATTALLLFVHAAVYPGVSGLSDARSARLDLLLSGGKTNRAAQLPMLILWYGSLITSAVFFVYAAGRFACEALGARHSLCAPGCGALACALSALGAAKEGVRARFCAVGAIAVAAIWLLIWTARRIRRRG